MKLQRQLWEVNTRFQKDSLAACGALGGDGR